MHSSSSALPASRPRRAARSGVVRRNGASDSWRASVEFLRAFARALRDPGTYDVRSNPGLWLGFAFAVPIPVLVAVSSAPAWIVVASLAAPFAWSVLVGASGRVGILGGSVIRGMKVDAADRQMAKMADDERYDDLHGAAETERREHERLVRLQRLAVEDLALGQIIQRSLVPAGIKREGLEVVLRHIPCAHVGGDYLQASLPRAGLLYLCVGDVAGHGVAAALVVSRLHALVQGMIRDEIRPGPFLESLNRATLRLFERTTFFMTFAVLRIDLLARTIEYATAGHPAQWLLRSGGDIEELATANVALGLGPTTPDWTAATATYSPGDRLLLFTDGLFEVRAPGGGIWGEESLMSALVRVRRREPELVVSEILREADAFRGVRAFEDDVSLLMAEFGTGQLAAASSGLRVTHTEAERRPALDAVLAKERP